jgi:hypothetical protein
VIIKEVSGMGGPALARYLTGGKNERSATLGFWNLDAPSLDSALFRMDMTAAGGKAQRHILHLNMRAAPGEYLSPEQWQQAADMMISALNAENKQAALVMHWNPDGTTHAHLVINRASLDGGKVLDLWRSHEKCNLVRLEIEREFNLQRTRERRPKEQQRDNSRKNEPENQQARRTGEKAHEIRDTIRQAMEQSDSGKGFQQAMLEAGLFVAKGDRRDFVAVGPEGGLYSINRATGLKAEQVRERLADLDPEKLPSVDEAKTMQAYIKEYGPEIEPKPEKEKEKDGRGDATAAAGPTFKRPHLEPGPTAHTFTPTGRPHENILRDVADVILADTSATQQGKKEAQEQEKDDYEKDDEKRIRHAFASVTEQKRTEWAELLKQNAERQERQEQGKEAEPTGQAAGKDEPEKLRPGLSPIMAKYSAMKEAREAGKTKGEEREAGREQERQTKRRRENDHDLER